jgi:hypothetical protein
LKYTSPLEGIEGRIKDIMQIQMKNLKLFTLIILALITISFSELRAQDLVMIRAYEAIGGSNSKMITVTPDGNSVEVQLNMGIINKASENTLIIHNEVNTWIKAGFDVIASTVIEVERIVITTYVLKK